MTPNRVVALALSAILGLVVLFALVSIVETLDATEIMVIQDPWDGDLHWHTTPGIKAQWFGRVTKYHRRSQYWFSEDKGGVPVHIRFFDGGNAEISGSIAWEMPLDEKTLTKLHTKYGNQSSADDQLLRTIVDKAVYFTGPTMSSKESYSDRRNDLIGLIQDQVNHGVYQTQSVQKREKDEITGLEKIHNAATIMIDKDGNPKRQEVSPLEEFGIRAFNLSIKSVAYDATVEKQIQQQQALTMEVQTAMVTAKKAEQAVITVEKEGQANAAQAKWLQEVIKAKEVTAAQQRLEVARLDAESAAQEKRKQILLGEGEAERRKLVMSADGALEIKVNAWLESQKVWATAIGAYKGKLVPDVTMGTASANGASTMQSMMELLSVKAARDLSIDMNVPGEAATSRK